jgi:hypothetical protein
MTHNVQGFMLLGYLLPSCPVPMLNLHLKSSLFVQKIKDAGHAQTEDWRCF